MEAGYSFYDIEKSVERITEILDSSDSSYEEKNEIPTRDNLTFTNGYYVDVSVLFVDLRDSTSLTSNHTRPVLAKIYRAYISEMVAVLKSVSSVREVYIEGDGLWAVFNTPYKPDIDDVFDVAARVSSLTEVLNIKLQKKGYSKITIGIGLDYGTALYIKAGYKGSGINEVVWLGKVVGGAAHLCKQGNKNWNNELMVSSTFRSNLKELYQGFLSWNSSASCYHGKVYSESMKEWIDANK